MQNALLEHSAILLTYIKLPFVFKSEIKTLVLSIFEWPLKTGFTVFSPHTVTSFLYSHMIFLSTGCPKSFVDLPALPSQVSCYIPKSCTAIDCCVDIPKTGLSIHSSLDIDLCTNRVSGGIEQETFDFSLFKYEWGKLRPNIHSLVTSIQGNRLSKLSFQN